MTPGFPSLIQPSAQSTFAAAEDIARRLSRLSSTLARHPSSQIISVTLDIADFRLREAPRLADGDFYFAHPEAGLRLWGRGRAASFRSQGGARWSVLSSHLRQLQSTLGHVDADHTGVSPRLFCALAFDPDDSMTGPWSGYPNSGLFLPELLLHQDRQGCRVTFSGRGDTPGGLLERWTRLAHDTLISRPTSPGMPLIGNQLVTDYPLPDTRWLQLARQGVAEIEQERLAKVVLYRRRHFNSHHPIALHHAAGFLQRTYPQCRLFATRQNHRGLVCATPERLLRIQGTRLSSDALAGTERRSSDPQQDRQLGSALYNNPKTRHEQRLVVDAIRQALQPVCDELEIPAQPELQRLTNVQHLWSRIRGTLKRPGDILDVAARLHPTPAVCGTPAEAAMTWLREHGQSHRGWYSGVGGWLDLQGNGELDVLLRCALLHQRQATLFAGAGLVRGSDPRAELEEIEFKLRAALDALNYAGAAQPE